MLAYDRAAHLPGRPTSRLEADEVEVEPVVELAPKRCALRRSRERPQHPPDAPGPARLATLRRYGPYRHTIRTR